MQHREETPSLNARVDTDFSYVYENIDQRIALCKKLHNLIGFLLKTANAINPNNQNFCHYNAGQDEAAENRLNVVTQEFIDLHFSWLKKNTRKATAKKTAYINDVLRIIIQDNFIKPAKTRLSWEPELQDENNKPMTILSLARSEILRNTIAQDHANLDTLDKRQKLSEELDQTDYFLGSQLFSRAFTSIRAKISKEEASSKYRYKTTTAQKAYDILHQPDLSAGNAYQAAMNAFLIVEGNALPQNNNRYKNWSRFDETLKIRVTFCQIMEYITSMPFAENDEYVLMKIPVNSATDIEKRVPADIYAIDEIYRKALDADITWEAALKELRSLVTKRASHYAKPAHNHSYELRSLFAFFKAVSEVIEKLHTGVNKTLERSAPSYPEGDSAIGGYGPP